MLECSLLQVSDERPIFNGYTNVMSTLGLLSGLEVVDPLGFQPHTGLAYRPACLVRQGSLKGGKCLHVTELVLI